MAVSGYEPAWVAAWAHASAPAAATAAAAAVAAQFNRAGRQQFIRAGAGTATWSATQCSSKAQACTTCNSNTNDEPWFSEHAARHLAEAEPQLPLGGQCSSSSSSSNQCPTRARRHQRERQPRRLRPHNGLRILTRPMQRASRATPAAKEQAVAGPLAAGRKAEGANVASRDNWAARTITKRVSPAGHGMSRIGPAPTRHGGNGHHGTAGHQSSDLGAMDGSNTTAAKSNTALTGRDPEMMV
mmetsp:Transcript_57119/g.110270  ORF Transcript_57119/g.110270 Transcript_57119/m.110270 type:complete len:242 (+) Transcript_57119:642-1367(+)